ncbi:flavin-containing monooxygenase [Rhodococcus triatomae]|nr:flavin-containing monooxygenase [Rhodococcus triatomae BKS 15-14]
MSAPSSTSTADRYALIGAGPSGLAGARNLSRLGIPFDGFESHTEVGGLWNIDNPRSTVYRSAHLISSKTTTQFTEFPMPAGTPDYPGHRELREYFEAYAQRFDLHRHFRFGTTVTRVEPDGDGWIVATETGGTATTARYRGVIIANGTLSEPNMPAFAGTFAGELLHTSTYRDPRIFDGKRVLIIGAGNSGCDIAVDAVHHARSVDISVRRGYHFVPKYMLGRPADTLGGRLSLPPWLKQRIDSRLLRLFTGDPVRFGFPEPDHRLYESHPIVNSLILHHAGHGDVTVRADLDRFDGNLAHFTDGHVGDYDLVVCATGYRLHYPFIAPEHLDWGGRAPSLYLNIASRRYPTLFVLGMIEASGIGWQGRHEQAELVAKAIRARDESPESAAEFAARVAGPEPDLSGGYRYLDLDRMSYYVNRDAYRRTVVEHIARFDAGASTRRGSVAPSPKDAHAHR